MDVTPQLLKDVDFREKKFGGYDPDEVDDFLERVGVAIGQLQMRLREMTQRAEAAEARLAEQPAATPAVASEVDDTLRRTLLLAQRTADAAVAEAREESERIVAAAQDEAERIRAEDAARHERELTESQDEIRRAGDEARNRILTEVDELEGIRDQLMADVEVLERHVDDERARLQTTVATLQGLLDAAGAMAPLEPPVVTAVVPPRAESEPNYEDPGSGMATPEIVPEAAFEEAAYEPLGTIEPPAPAPADDAPLFRAPEAAAPPPAFDPLPPAPTFGEPEPPAPAQPAGSVWDAPAEDVFAPEPGAPSEDLFAQPPPPPPPPAEHHGFGGLDAPADAPAGDPWADLPGTGPATQPVAALPDEGGDNPWMADLAREEAANAPAPPVPEGEGDDAMAEWYRGQEEAGGGDKGEKHKRFGRKK
ncbi:MAG: DivIVA domain-containing protein [Acidimicrobiales bacterium]|nr:DivIVA domain-containing protein [Acidimicrobiales bacterium]